MKNARVLIHRYNPTSGCETLKYMWEGPIDGEIYVAIEFIGDPIFEQIPFKLKRMRDYDSRTAVFIRWDWQARIARLFRRRKVWNEFIRKED